MGFCLIAVFGVLGFAYLIWILANKENGTLKLIGQVISILLVVAIILAGVSGNYRGHYYGHPMKSGCMMNTHQGMDMREKHMMDVKDMKNMMHGTEGKESSPEKK
ncbi:MAG: hypothetical protein AABZ14_02700 [Candidatus Margulisiibacteriota bacterium]